MRQLSVRADSRRPGRALPGDGERRPRPEMPRVGHRRGARRAQPGQPREEHAECGLHFQPRQRRTNAGVQPGAERHVRIATARHIKALGVGEPARISVGCAQEQSHFLAPTEGHTLELDIVQRVAGEQMQRRVVAEHLLHDAHGVRQESRGGIAALCQQGGHPVADAVHGGLVPGVEQEDRGGHQLVGGHRRAVGIPRLEQAREDVVARCRSAFCEQPTHVGAEGLGGRHGAILDAAVAPHLIDGDHIVRPGEELRRHGRGHAEEVGNDEDGDVACEDIEQVGLPSILEAIDELVGDALDVPTEQLDAPRDEWWIDHGAEPRVRRRFEFEQGVLLEGQEGRQVRVGFGPAEFGAGAAVEDLAPEAAIAKQRVDGVEAGEAGVAERGPDYRLAGIAEVGVGRVRVPPEVGIAGLYRTARELRMGVHQSKVRPPVPGALAPPYGATATRVTPSGMLTIRSVLPIAALALASACNSDSSTGPGGTVELTLGAAVSVSGAGGGSERYFTVVVPAGAGALRVSLSGGSGDADLIVRFGARPNPEAYDCGSFGFDNDEECIIASPNAGTWHILVLGFDAYSGAQLLAETTAAPSTTPLTSGVAVTNQSGAESSSRFFSITVPAGTTQLTVTTTGGTGDMDLYLRLGNLPSTGSFDCESANFDNDETCTVNSPAAGTWYVMLYGFEAYAGVTITATLTPP